MSGTPIVGYEGLYQADLLGNLSSQLLTPTDDRVALAAKITELHKNRELLCSVAAQCKVLGQSFSDEAVFKHRSDLIKEHFRDRE